MNERTGFDTSAGLPMCTAKLPEGRGPWMARVNPTLFTRHVRHLETVGGSRWTWIAMARDNRVA